MLDLFVQGFQQMGDLLAIAMVAFGVFLGVMFGCVPDIPYNFLLHTQPLRSEPLDHYHWHFEIVPKLTSIAGFEWGSGFYINPLPPELSCTFLKEVKLDEAKAADKAEKSDP